LTAQQAGPGLPAVAKPPELRDTIGLRQRRRSAAAADPEGRSMISKFTTVYAGHVDLPDRGQESTPANERRYSNQHLASVFEKTEAIAKQMDALGYDTLWLAEHHFQHEGYECIPNILMLAVHLAHVTKQLKIGCGFNIVPMWHPLRLAEDFATADILTGGRTVFGVGRGYHTREVETFGGPMLDGEANREIFEEGVEIIFKAFNEESFSHKGAYYTLPPRVPYRGYELEKLTLVPRPIHRPVECWQPIVSASPRGLDFMVKHGIKGAVGGGAATMQGGPIIAYQEAAARAGKQLELGENLQLGLHFHLARSREQAVREIKPIYEEHVKMFAPLGFVPGLTPAQADAVARRGGWDAAGVPTVEHFMKLGSWFAGTPAELVDLLKDFEERYPGMQHISLSSPLGTPQATMLEQFQWVAEEVMPAFRPNRS
jgi:alkanesulfonate monooxygenase SsuD/methylene tetrahydromethanopterin reductase-like flavin-dependent oxidoreductase (luciferase family)